MAAVLQLFRDLGPAKLSALIGVAVVFMAGFIVLSLKLSTPALSPLYNNLDLKDSGAIVSALEAESVPYELRANGSQVLVPEDRVLRLRMTMAQQGLPSKGSIVGYEIFDNSETLGTSSFVQNVNLLRTLEGELGRTIASFANIESARVHLVIPKRELFTRDRQEPSASVILQIKGKGSLSKEEVNAISHLVATAVPGLATEKITIVNTTGKSFKLGAKDPNDPEMMASSAEDYRTSLESRMRNTIADLLEKSVGSGKVEVQVSAEVNFDRIVTNSETYDPEGQVPRSVQTVEETESATDKASNDNVSVANNLPNAQGNPTGAQSASNSRRIDETTNFEISKTIKNHISQTGTVKRLSIAVLVDGTYNTNKETGEITYTPRTDQELQKLEALAKSAIGFDANRNDKFEMVNLQFTSDLEALKEETTLDWLKRELHGLIQTVVIGAVVILVILMVIRPIVGRAFAMNKFDQEEELQDSLSPSHINVPSVEQQMEEAESLIAIEQLESRGKSASFKTMSDLVDKYPEETLSILRQWLSKD